MNKTYIPITLDEFIAQLQRIKESFPDGANTEIEGEFTITGLDYDAMECEISTPFSTTARGFYFKNPCPDWIIELERDFKAKESLVVIKGVENGS